MVRALLLTLATASCARAPTLASKQPWPTQPSAPRTGAVVEHGDTLPGDESVVLQDDPSSRLAAAGGVAHLPSLEPWSAEDEPLAELPRVLTFGWPLAASGISSTFGRRRDPIDGGERKHQGLDLPAAYGAVVEATADGLVIYSGWSGAHGRVVVISHPGAYQSLYAHLAQATIPTGARVRAGQAIGLLGNSGRSTGPHLHFEIRHRGAPVDPLALLGNAIRVGDSS